MKNAFRPFSKYVSRLLIVKLSPEKPSGNPRLKESESNRREKGEKRKRRGSVGTGRIHDLGVPVRAPFTFVPDHGRAESRRQMGLPTALRFPIPKARYRLKEDSLYRLTDSFGLRSSSLGGRSAHSDFRNQDA